MYGRKKGFLTDPSSPGLVQERHFPAVHKRDAAEAFCLALEKGERGKVYHATAENVSLRGVLELVGRETGLEVRDVGDTREVMELVGGLGVVMGKDNPVSSEWSRRELEWQSKEVGLLEEIEGNYFR